MLNKIRILTLILLLLPTLCFAQSTTTVNTYELYDVGATDFELYMDFTGLGLGKYEKTISTSALLGYGFNDRFSGYFYGIAMANEYFNEASGGLGFGLLSGLIQTERIELDLIFNIETFAFSSFSLNPFIEFNYYFDKEKWRNSGFYIWLGETITGRDDSTPDDPTTTTIEAVTDYSIIASTDLLFAAYYSLYEKHRLLLQFDMLFNHYTNPGEDIVGIGGVALGYNVFITDTIELLTSLSFDIPQEGEDFSVGIGAGLVIGMPPVK